MTSMNRSFTGSAPLPLSTGPRSSASRSASPRGGIPGAVLSVAAVSLLFWPAPCLAYIGPGAGFAFIGSTFVFVLTLGLGALTLAIWPLQWAVRRIRGRGVSRKARARRVVIVGLDGLEPSLAERYMQQGLLPNMQKLKERGAYSRLGTTLPALSPVAWSTFQTGVNPGAHNIFDFLTRDKRHLLPTLASTEIRAGKGRVSLGPIKLWRRKAEVHITRKSEPFWKILGRHGVFSNIIRVPISYPPEKFEGNVLSAMCTPDLKGTQGSFSFFRSDAESLGEHTIGGQLRKLVRSGQSFSGEIEGPPDPGGKGYLKCPFSLHPGQDSTCSLALGQTRHTLRLNEFSGWIEIEFKPAHGKAVSGIARFCLRELSPQISLYVSPVNIHPEKPALPVSSPAIFSSWLARKNGLYGTLGLMEDTWGRNEHALDDARFLEQSYLTHAEREKMFFEVLDRTKEGLCCCVFDASDRIQHMFWRYLDDKHPSPREKDGLHKDAIPQMYQRMDELVGRVMQRINKDDLLFILSDHGFTSFRRGVNVNTWLWQNGYLALKGDKPSGADYLADVDWSKTRAFALGLSGIYINRQGREQYGIVPEPQCEKLKAEIAQKLQGLTDPLDGQSAISRVFDTAVEYRGLYAEEAPDLVVGYRPGFRVSWESVTGTFEKEVFTDNIKAWSGDHHVDPELIPGVLFCNRPLKKEKPAIVDMAPTMLDLFAIKPPRYMEGSVIV